MEPGRAISRFGAFAFAALAFSGCEDGSPGRLEPEQDGRISVPKYDLKNVPRWRFARPPLAAIPRPSAAADAEMIKQAKLKKAKKRVPLTNGSFEQNGGETTSLFSGWTVVNIPSLEQSQGSWFVQTGDAAPLQGVRVDSPSDGSFAAMTDQFSVGTAILYQDVMVPHGKPMLSFDIFILNFANEEGQSFFSPNTLSPNGTNNQQFRMDIMDPGAPIDDVGSGVLRRVYRTEHGDPVLSHYRTVQTSLAEFAGRTVRLRFAVVNNRDVLEVGIDRVMLGPKALFRGPQPK